MLEQNQIAATVFYLDGSRFVGMILRDNAVLEMPEIGVEFSLP